MTCTFFGNRDTPETARPKLKEALENLVLDGVSLFYIGNEGNFDKMALEELQLIQKAHPHIKYFVVLAYPEHNLDPGITLYPEGMELALPKFAIDKRNRWMLKQADTVVAHVTHHGGAMKYRETAKKQGKRIIDLA